MIAGVWLRLLLGAAAVAALLVAAAPMGSSEAVAPLVFGSVLLIGWLLIKPESAAGSVVIAAAVLMRLILGTDTADSTLIALVVLLPLVHQSAALTAQLPPTGVAQWPAVRPTVVRYAASVGAVVVALMVIRLVG